MLTDVQICFWICYWIPIARVRFCSSSTQVANSRIPNLESSTTGVLGWHLVHQLYVYCHFHPPVAHTFWIKLTHGTITILNSLSRKQTTTRTQNPITVYGLYVTINEYWFYFQSSVTSSGCTCMRFRLLWLVRRERRRVNHKLLHITHSPRGSSGSALQTITCRWIEPARNIRWYIISPYMLHTECQSGKWANLLVNLVLAIPDTSLTWYDTVSHSMFPHPP